MNRRTFLVTCASPVVDLRGPQASVSVYRQCRAGFEPIAWAEQRPGDVVLRIAWRGRVLERLHLYRVLEAPDMTDPIGMPVLAERSPSWERSWGEAMKPEEAAGGHNEGDGP